MHSFLKNVKKLNDNNLFRGIGLLALLFVTGCVTKNIKLGDDSGDTEITDYDGDGYSINDGDCDDADARIHPGVPEVCDGIDQNCDLSIDEGVMITFYADNDGDGYGDINATGQSCALSPGFVADSSDCDDSSNSIYPGAEEVCNGLDDNCDGVTDEGVLNTFYADSDGDGYGDLGNTQDACTEPSGFVSDFTDCDDTNNSTFPDASESCNGLDDNCDGVVDNSTIDNDTWYADSDGDGYGDLGASTLSCLQPTGYVSSSTDCDDTSSNIFPGNSESCNGIDDNCDGLVDEDLDSTWYADNDGDGYGDPDSSGQACTQPSGYVSDNTDCNDGDVSINPNGSEVCNSTDDDCDGMVDDNASDASTWYQDNDNDLYGNNAIVMQSCDWPIGYAPTPDDCDDSNGAIYPDMIESCNGLDDNCDGVADENASDASTWYNDGDGDGYGNPAIFTTECNTPVGYVSDNTDCEDTQSSIFPNANESCNGRDDNCDGVVDEATAIDTAVWYADADFDGYGDMTSQILACSAPVGYSGDGTDCDDSSDTIRPGADEYCNGLDDNCNGTADENAMDDTIWYPDNDGDGFGEHSASVMSCDAPTGYVSINTDCNDGNAAVNTSATEVCDGQDNNCDYATDEDSAVDATLWYLDDDHDGYGNVADVGVYSCWGPPGSYSEDNGDCDDSNAAIEPIDGQNCSTLSYLETASAVTFTEVGISGAPYGTLSNPTSIYASSLFMSVGAGMQYSGDGTQICVLPDGVNPPTFFLYFAGPTDTFGFSLSGMSGSGALGVYDLGGSFFQGMAVQNGFNGIMSGTETSTIFVQASAVTDTLCVGPFYE